MTKSLMKKPIGAVMVFLSLVILGGVSSRLIPISLTPDINIPEITVQVSMDNTSSRALENVIIRSLRQRLSETTHLNEIHSVTEDDLSNIYLTFDFGADMDLVFIEVNEKVDRVMSQLPREVSRPQVLKHSASDIPAFYLDLTLNKDTLTDNSDLTVDEEFMAFSRFVDQVIRKRIEQLPGVAMIDMTGLTYPEIRIIPDEEKLQTLGISLNDIKELINAHQSTLGNILVVDGQYQYNIRMDPQIATKEDIENLYFSRAQHLIQLKNIAEIEQRPQKRNGLVLSNSKESITLAVIKQSNARMGDLKTELDKLMVALTNDYPDINIDINRDQTRLLDYSLDNLIQSLFWGIFLAFGVLLVFLRSFVAPVLIAIVVPVALVISLFLFYVFNISINIISLSGLVLGTGLMIDNAIIVLDNINQFHARGIPLATACVRGTREVLSPMFSSVLTTCAVFVPLVFMKGMSGALFYDQAMAVTISLSASLLVSIFLLPILYNQLKGIKWAERVNLHFQKMKGLNYEALYENGFRFVMKNQLLFGVFMLFSFFVAVVVFPLLPKSQLPELTKTETILEIDWNERITAEENKERVFVFLDRFKEHMLHTTALIGTQDFLLNHQESSSASESSIYIKTSDEATLNKMCFEMSHFIDSAYTRVTYGFFETENVFNLLFSKQVAPLVANVRPSESNMSIDFSEFSRLWKEVGDSVQQRLDPVTSEEHFVLLVNDDKLISYGIYLRDLENKLKTLLNNNNVATIVDDQYFIPVVMGSEPTQLNQLLHEAIIFTDSGTGYPLKYFIKLIRREDFKEIVADVGGQYYPLSFEMPEEDIPNTSQIIKKIGSQYKSLDIDFKGTFFDNKQLIKELSIILGISVLLLYFILAAQFESLMLPLIVLLEIPLDIGGSLLLLKIFGMGINMMSMIGMIVASGIIINDSILKIDTINRLRQEGMPLLKALLVAGQRRLKPILMTSITTILALIPLLFSKGIGAELQAPLALSIIGGMVLGTVISLYFIPWCYYRFSKMGFNF